ncbi:hypothetical protein HPB49_001139 [Dermacentor silvarum]|uniref:Uncharacterized protein n=1 Tax=Dermacentor silvarum TaxID=543639 RepID=A0ACB8D9R3_DERSI|nr:hypothetical protein HPB49_001139 [Dermacentor silvarum]
MADTRMDDDVSSETEDGEEGMGWQVVTNRRSRSAGKTWGAGGTAHLTQELQGKEIANKGADGADKLKRRIVKASRMPQLPKEHRKIIVRPRGGLNLNKVSTTAIGEAIVEAAGLTEDQAKGDIVCPNFTQSIVVVSTPDFDHAERKNMEIAVVYYRSGYSASQMTEEDWETRLTIELSSAVKCPSLGYQLAGTKKVQQVLAQEGIVERFFPGDVKAVQRIRSTFVGSYSLDLTPEGDSAAQKAMRSPSKYVLKKEGEADDLVEMLVMNSDFAHTSDSY